MPRRPEGLAAVRTAKGPPSAAELASDIGDVFKKASQDGLVGTKFLATLLSDLDGREWTEDCVQKVVDAAGCSADGQIQVDEFLAWVLRDGATEGGLARGLLEPQLDGVLAREVEPAGSGPFLGDGAAPRPAALEEDGVNSPKVPARKRRAGERRAHIHVAAEGERLFRPESHSTGLLLLRPDGSFSYVHDAQARFSEGVGGDWAAELPGDSVRLQPRTYGYCYEESFDPHEILEARPLITLCNDRLDDDGKPLCTFADDFLVFFSWLDPTLPERERATPGATPVHSGGGVAGFEDVQEGQPEVVHTPSGRVVPPPVNHRGTNEESPCSPKVPARTRKSKEPRAHSYWPDEGEQLYCPASHTSGMLIVRPDGTFAYVHDAQARFSEGVGGEWTRLDGSKVELRPKTIGYCYEESFDPNEILHACYAVELSEERSSDNGRLLCVLPEDLRTRFSWLNPTLPEDGAEGLGAFSGQADAIGAEEEPTSPKIARGARRNHERRANVYKIKAGERLFRPESLQAAVLLLRPDNTFSYVHDGHARFSEGIGGTWTAAGGEVAEAATLEPQSFGYCYEESFDAKEVVGVCHTVTLCPDRVGEAGTPLCVLAEDLRNRFSWLNPTIPEDPSPTNKKA